LRTLAIPERFCGGDSLRRGAIIKCMYLYLYPFCPSTRTPWPRSRPFAPGASTLLALLSRRSHLFFLAPQFLCSKNMPGTALTHRLER